MINPRRRSGSQIYVIGKATESEIQSPRLGSLRIYPPTPNRRYGAKTAIVKMCTRISLLPCATGSRFATTAPMQTSFM